MRTEIGSYEFVGPGKIVFGWGRRHEGGKLVQTLAARAAIIWGSRTLRGSAFAGEILAALKAAGVDTVELATISHEPLVADVDTTTWALRESNLGQNACILAIGGGAAIDLAKAVAAMATSGNGHSVQDFLEGVGRGMKIAAPPLPVVAMPTTAGTGSEATKNAVISSLDPPFKKSLRSERMLPKIVLIDPELATTCPPSVTAHSGMDAITQCLESYVSRKAKPIARTLAAEGFLRGMQSLAEAVENGGSRSAREGMAHAALLSGMALANSGLGVAHGVAAALGVRVNVPHGLACAVMLRGALAVNRACCENPFAELERQLGGESAPTRELAERLESRIRALCDRLKIPATLGSLGVDSAMIPDLVTGSHGNSLDGNPRTLSDPEIRELLESML